MDDFIGLIFNKDDDDEGPGNSFSIRISRRAIIKSPTLYSYFRQNPSQQNYQIKIKCKKSFSQMIQLIFSKSKSLMKGFPNCVNDDTIDFLTKLNHILKIPHLGTNIKDFEKDKDFLNGSNYQNWKYVHELLHFQGDNDEGELFNNIELLNEMKISNSLLSLRNRMSILTKIVNLRNNELFKNYISQELDNEIQEFQKEIDSIPRHESDGNITYDTISDVIRFDDSKRLQAQINSEPDFDFTKKYSFDLDFSDLLPTKATIFELSVYFNAISCYTYINSIYIKAKVFKKDSLELINVPKFAFASGNSTMIEFCKQHKLLKLDDLSIYLDISIAYQNNHLYDWLLFNYTPKITSNSSKLAVIANNISILSDLIITFGADMNLALFQAFDNNYMDILTFLIQLRASNINYGMDGI